MSETKTQTNRNEADTMTKRIINILDDTDTDITGKISILRTLHKSLDFWTDASERDQADRAADYMCVNGLIPKH